MKKISWLFGVFTVLIACRGAFATELRIGTATMDITPPLPFALMGQFDLRIARTVETPLTANVIALELRNGNHSQETAILISCDLATIPTVLLTRLRESVRKQLPELDVRKIIVNATHTHTSPVLANDLLTYPIPKEGVTQLEACQTFVVNRLTEAVVKAWKNRSPGSVSWGLGQAVVGANRRVVYANGGAALYGGTNVPEFQHLEGTEDHGIHSLFFWNTSGKLMAIGVAVACPAQEVEGHLAVNADYWHTVRIQLQKRFGAGLCVLGWVGASGDVTSHLLYRQAAEERMLRLKKGNSLEEIGKRISNTVIETYEVVEKERTSNVPLVHTVATLSLPMQLVNDADYAVSKAEHDKAVAQMAADVRTTEKVYASMSWHRDAMTRYETQKTVRNPTLETEVHVLRLGDVALCTNPFELFTDYGIQIQARSKALQTVVVELVGPGTYLPTERAVRGGGYSAISQSNLVGPEGGKVLVDRTVELINDLWR
ncbi:neutral/alkaline non-lysosomal ceramidase N-terminal domain-containing protein [Larkinella harenae]